MGYKLKAEGDNIDELQFAVGVLQPGEYGEVRIYVTVPPDENELANIQNQLLQSAVILTRPVWYDSSTGAIVIEFQESEGGEGTAALPALPLIGIVAGTIVLVGGFIFFWKVSGAVIGSGGLSDLWVLVGIVWLIMILKSNAAKSTGRAASRKAGAITDKYIREKMFEGRPVETRDYRSPTTVTDVGEYEGPVGGASGAYQLKSGEASNDIDDR